MTTTRFQISRRNFLKTSATAAAAAGLPLWFWEREAALAAPAPATASPNDRPGIALVGCGGMGRGDAANATRFGDIVAVCDVDRRRAEEAAKQFTKGEKKPAIYDDFRKVMERAEVRVVINATPDHWHTFVNLAAAKARKDVYSEKPLTLTIDEGRRLATAVRQNKIVLQTGSQQRSDRHFRLACELARHGRLGQLKQIIVYLPAGLRGGPFPSQPAPEGLNWDFYLGQAPKVDYVKERCHTTFRYWLDYSGGTMTDWGAHHNDIARWAVGLKGPVAVEGKVLATPVPGGYTAPSEYEVRFTYANGVRHIVRSTPDDSIYGGGGEQGRAAQRPPLRGDQRLAVGHARRPARQRRGAALGSLARGRQAAGGEQRPHGQLFRVRSFPSKAYRQRGRGPSLRLGLPPGRHRPADRAPAEMGPGPGTIHRRNRRRRQPAGRARAARAVRLHIYCLIYL